MPYKMIVTDLDGTLLRSDGTLSDHTLSVLRSCHTSGIKILFATARAFRRVKPFLDFVPCDMSICHSGAAIYADNHRNSELSISTEAAIKILHSLHTTYPNMPLIADCSEKLYANFDVSRVWKNVFAENTDFTKSPNEAVEKIYAGIDSEKTLNELRTYLPENMNIRKLNDNFILITNRAATKENALKIAAKHFGIEMNEILAFGNDSGDIEMLRVSGSGAAVQNAIEDVKKIADLITESNDEDGVACCIERLFSFDYIPHQK